jgi:diguanylate cyclase (GGDEF)-like protein
MFTVSHFRDKIQFGLWTLAYACASVLIINSISFVATEREMNAERIRVGQQLALVRAKIEAALFMDTYLADSLATVVIIDPDFVMNHWATVAQRLLERSRYVKSVAVAPNDIIVHTYPLLGNEKAIGLDYRTNSAQWKAVNIARERQKVYISGPVELVQGGIALIARYPIFSDYPVNEKYWGLVSVVIDYQRLLDDSGLGNFNGADIALKKTIAENDVNPVFYGNPDIFEALDFELPINLPEDSWILGAKLTGAAQVASERFGVLTQRVGFVIALFGYLSLFFMYKHYKLTRQQSLYDDLTHLPNRRFFFSLLKRMTAKTDGSQNFSLLNIDLDGFKQVNDDLGHEAGDELLKYIADKLRENIRTSDHVARLGGDEFVVYLKDVIDERHIEKIIDKIRHSIEQHHFTWLDNHICPSLSIGYAVYYGQDITVKELLAQADNEMYKQKRSNRG